MKTETAELSNERYVIKSLQALLEGEKDSKWVVGIIRATRMDTEAIMRILAGLPSYGLLERRAELMAWLK